MQHPLLAAHFILTLSVCLSLSLTHTQKQRPKRVKALFNCVADNPDELTFTEGEVIVVDGEEDQEWWVSRGHTDRVHMRPPHTGHHPAIHQCLCLTDLP